MKLLRPSAQTCATVIITLFLAPLLHGEERSLIVLFGPAFAGTSRQGAVAAAASTVRWLEKPGSRVQVRRAGDPEPQDIDSRLKSKEMTRLFITAAEQAREADPSAFIAALDAATQAAALMPGVKLIAAIVNTPPLSSEAEQSIDAMVQFCREHAIRVIVLDLAANATADPNAPLSALASRTGGMWLRNAKALEGTVEVVMPKRGAGDAQTVTAAPASLKRADEPGAARTESPIPFEIPVHTRFIRTSSTGSVATGSAADLAGTDVKNSSAMMVERPFEANQSYGPLRGLLMVESPLSALKFESDDTSGTYQARARITATVRNSKGVAVWAAQKESSLHGPLRKLQARKSGSLHFLRSITLLGGDRYTLEAKIDDLIGGTTGTVQTPLRAGSGAPGLMASDALCVRPFKGAADRFEADQVFSYEGEALSPVLDPVFRAESNINLQLYFILYPDLYGPPPDLSIELSRDGQVVTRMPLQFKNPLADPSRDGKFGTLGGKGAVMLGGKPREFPYLATIKGAKLSPGNYEGHISIRQGRNVITRDVDFRVTGNAIVAGTTGAANDASIPPAEDLSSVALPEIETATVDSSGLAVDIAEQKRLWSEASAGATGYSNHLPNFRCTQETHRFVAPAKTPEQLKESDSLKEEVTYEDGRERYRTLAVNGIPVDRTRAELKGVQSQGEFGSMLSGLFDPTTRAEYKWAGRSIAMGVLCQVFEVRVQKDKSNFSLTHNGRREAAAYSGRVFIDEETGQVRRLAIQGTDLPKDFGLQSPAFSLDYGIVRIGSDDYLLPLRSVLQLRQGKAFVRNETVFREYRRFEGSSEIKYEDPQETVR